MLLTQEQRDTANRHRAASRARTKLRRYAVRNQLTRLVTLTYRCTACGHVPCSCGLKAQPATRAEVKRHVNRAVVELRELLGRAFPYVYVIERGTRGTRRLHVHLLVDADVFAKLLATGIGPPNLARIGPWKHGTVDLESANGRSHNSARDAARYLSKRVAWYVSKALHDEDPAWAHSYERSQGWNVRRVRRQRLHSIPDALFVIAHTLGAAVDDLQLSWSDDWTGFMGPPTAVVTFSPD